LHEAGFHGYGLSLEGSNNIVRNVKTSGAGHGIRIRGASNNITTAIFSDCGSGLVLYGTRNKLMELQVENIRSHGVSIYGDNNAIESVKSIDAKTAVQIMGKYNKLTDVEAIVRGAKSASTSIIQMCGVLITYKSAFNEIERVTCTGFTRGQDDWAIFIEQSMNNSVSHCNASPISVTGGGHYFKDVIVGGVDGLLRIVKEEKQFTELPIHKTFYPPSIFTKHTFKLVNCSGELVQLEGMTDGEDDFINFENCKFARETKV